MNEIIVYGLSGLLICFTVLTFLLSRIPTDIYPEDYEFKLDPFWYIIALMFVGGTVLYFIFPQLPDMIREIKYINILLPFIFTVLIYGFYLLGSDFLTNLVTFACALTLSYIQPSDFMIFPEYLTLWQDRLAVAVFLFIISKGMLLLNGLGAIGSMQFSAVMIAGAVISYFGGLPHFTGCLALIYLGCMLAFSIFSWPPEKLLISHGAFAAFGFLMGAFMLNASTEFAEVPMFIAASYLVTEICLAFYNRYICNNRTPEFFMNTSYYRISEEGQYELGVVRGVFKILFINVVLSLMQIFASDRLALPVFTIALNLWFLSILSGDSKPEDLVSLSKWGKKMFKGIFSKKKKTD